MQGRHELVARLKFQACRIAFFNLTDCLPVPQRANRSHLVPVGIPLFIREVTS